MMNYGPTGRDGRWPHFRAIETFRRHWGKALPTVREIAVHEAGHVVVGHALGVLYSHATARPPGSSRSLMVFGNSVVSDSYFDLYSYEERILMHLAGPAADERQGCFNPFSIGEEEDEHQALTLAAVLAHRDPGATADTLRGAARKVRGMVGDHWPGVLQLAAELEARDLDSTDIERVLGPTPPLMYTERTARGHEGNNETFGEEIVLSAIKALVEGRPYGFACTPMTDGRTALVWMSTAGEWMVTVEEARLASRPMGEPGSASSPGRGRRQRA